MFGVQTFLEGEVLELVLCGRLVRLLRKRCTESHAMIMV